VVVIVVARLRIAVVDVEAYAAPSVVVHGSSVDLPCCRAMKVA
jgi:hypothetical protein